MGFLCLIGLLLASEMLSKRSIASNLYAYDHDAERIDGKDTFSEIVCQYFKVPDFEEHDDT